MYKPYIHTLTNLLDIVNKIIIRYQSRVLKITIVLFLFMVTNSALITTFA